MKIELRPVTAPFQHFLAQARIILGLWLKFVASTVAVSALIGPFAPLILSAFLFTLGLPVLLLTLWGRSLDQELQWGEMDEGPR
ncbi:MAG: hypothetical protein AAF367_01750 [Pseudomonadota bacterium]